MASPNELLRDLVDPESENFVIEQTELAKRCGVAFQTVWRWVHAKGHGFDEARQKQVAEVLGLPHNYFSNYEDLRVREQYRAKVFNKFLEDQLGHSATEDELRLLRAPRFDGKIAPTISTYRAWLLVLRGALTEEQLERALEERRRLLEEATAKVEAARLARRAAGKTPRKRRKKREDAKPPE